MNLNRMLLVASFVLAGFLSQTQLAVAQITQKFDYHFHEEKDGIAQIYQEIIDAETLCGQICQTRKAQLLAAVTAMGLTINSDVVTTNIGDILFAVMNQEFYYWEYHVVWDLKGTLTVTGTQSQLDALWFFLNMGAF